MDQHELIRQNLEQQLAIELSTLGDPTKLRGRWQIRFGGPVGSDEVQWHYCFEPDGTLTMDDGAVGSWVLEDSGHLLIGLPYEADPTLDLEAGVSEEGRHAFVSTNGRIVLSNDDTSIIEILQRT
ncbi:MAG: hypothetical protein AAF561_11590 [Planctomycetota bacterium]